MSVDNGDDWCVGYHFTPQDTWERSISHQGLVPYPIPHASVLRSVAEVTGGLTPPAIWLWPGIPSGVDLAGSLIDRVICHHATHVLLLRVAYRRESDLCVRYNQPGWRLTHSGSYSHSNGRKGAWQYHADAPFVLVVDPVPPEQLSVVAEWNLPELLASCVTLPSAEPSAQPKKARTLATACADSGSG